MYPQPSSQELASFWELLQLAIEDVRVKFQDLQRLRDSGWRLVPEKKVRGPGSLLPPQAPSPRAKMAVVPVMVPSGAVDAGKRRNCKQT